MDFKIVDIPNDANGGTGGNYGSLFEALKTNIGKAIEVPLGDKESNPFRKTLRAGFVSRGLDLKFKFNTKAYEDRKILVVWLTELNPTPAATPEMESIHDS